ncbi:MAG TPA: ABC transporter ATP-binding protein [Anaeromyxobacteraceae bacterium]|nr:ABC transporter ATP-binding protein [Anaeromyxobacteraceae bacterium]
MARIECQGLAHSYRGSPSAPEDWALHATDLEWKDGGAYALLGPSGSGKTTLLNLISGLVRPSRGRILFDGKDVTGLSTAQRNIAQVFQFPVVYDTMTVFDNLAFPLRNRGVGEREVKARVHEVAELLDLAGDLRRRAAGLSADAKQKISLGRGLVRSDVAAILFDEPLTVIDPHVKWMLRLKLKQIHLEFKLTLIYVTHDQAEALTFAERVVVLSEGRVLQVGSPTDLFEHPAHTFVGHFIGSPGMNLLPCQLGPDGVRVDGHAFRVDPARLERARRAGGELVLGIRPEFVRCQARASADAQAAEITSVEDLGKYVIATARLGSHLVKAKLKEGAEIAPGPGWVVFPPEWTLLYAGGTALD